MKNNIDGKGARRGVNFVDPINSQDLATKASVLSEIANAGHVSGTGGGVLGNFVQLVNNDMTAVENAGVSAASFQTAVYTEIGTLEIDISVPFTTTIVSAEAIGLINGVNLAYNQTSQQILIDLTSYAGSNNNLNIDQRIDSYTVSGGPSAAFGRNSITPSLQPLQFFSELPVIAPTPLVPMGNSYRFTPLDVNNGEYMKYWCFLSDTGVNGFVGEFRLEIMKQSRNNDQNITIAYQFQKYS